MGDQDVAAVASMVSSHMDTLAEAARLHVYLQRIGTVIANNFDFDGCRNSQALRDVAKVIDEYIASYR